ncbi:unnamed protein product, partial [Meganyctiphanes norvegica]
MELVCLTQHHAESSPGCPQLSVIPLHKSFSLKRWCNIMMPVSPAPAQCARPGNTIKTIIMLAEHKQCVGSAGEEVAQLVTLLQDALPRLTMALSQSPTTPYPPSYESQANPASFTHTSSSLIIPVAPLQWQVNGSSQYNPYRSMGGQLTHTAGGHIVPASPHSHYAIPWAHTTHDEKTWLLPHHHHKERRTSLLGVDRSAIFTASFRSGLEDSSSSVPSSKNRFSNKQWLALFSMLLLCFTSFSTMSILAPFFPQLVERKGLSSSMNGIIFSVYAFVIVVASPIVAKMVPITDPRTLYLIGIALTAVSNICFGLIQFIYEQSVFLLVSISLRVLEALGASCFLTVIYALVPELFPGDMSTINGMLETAIGLGTCVGPAMGVWLYSVGGFSLPFIVLGSFMLLTIPICWITFPTDVRPSGDGTPKGLISIMMKPGVLISFIILACTAMSQSMLYPSLQPHMDRLGVSVEHVGLIFLLLSAVYTITSPLVGLATDRYQCPELFMVAGLPIMTVALVFLGNSPILPFLTADELVKQDLIAIVLLGLSNAMCIVPTYACMLNHATEKHEIVDLGTSAICGGLWSASYSLGDMLGPLYAGFMGEYTGFAMTTSILALVPVVMTLFLGIFMCVQCHTSRVCKRSPLSPPTPSATRSESFVNKTLHSTMRDDNNISKSVHFVY